MINFSIRRLLRGTAPFAAGAAAILLAAAIVFAPESSFKASLAGLKLWWTIVFPALLPFLILSEMLTASGFVHGIGVLMEPLMKRLFRLPGAGGWTLVLGLTAGFPAGAEGVMQLHRQGDLTDKEAGRLASLVHYASPVTLLIVIGTAFLHSPAAGYALLALHWISGLAAGCIASRLDRSGIRKSGSVPVDASPQGTKTSLPGRIRQATAEARERDGRGFGKVLGESVSSAVQNLMIVGGYIIMFAVVINIAGRLFPQLTPLLTAGLLEIHLGARAITSAAGAEASLLSNPLGPALLSAAAAWSGICAQLQALTVLKAAKVRFLPFAAVRLLHSGIACGLTLLLWTPLLNLRTAVLPVNANLTPGIAALGSSPVHGLWSFIPQLLALQCLLILLLLALSAALRLLTSKDRPAG
ncbi:nucleoside recognition domain-containing protein [Paenibacillus piscarius]|uniref:nucleoside recognition domain-containing protein n=1 Tax=Paenibacillus piscarius TaxID=1089681 RepID=UPI001EE7D7FC|nr:nucleoside recognition domain-containing protein [Paenibacillus piscarius]